MFSSSAPAPDKKKDPLQLASHALREKKGCAWGSAKLEGPDGEGEWKEYFRAKDLVRFLVANPGKLDFALPSKRAGVAVVRTPQETAAELVRALMNRGMVTRTERKYKRPKPGRTRLVKWPRTLVLVKDQVWDENALYAWTDDRPTSIWYYIAIAMLPVVVVGMCLFPLAPWWMRIALVYFLMALLMLMMGTTLVRYLVFGVVWIATGNSLWILPNMMEEQASIMNTFKPLISYDKAKSITQGWKVRLVTLVVSASVLWLLASQGPGIEDVKEEFFHAHDSLLDYMDNMYKGKESLGEGTKGNVAAPGGSSSGSGSSSSSIPKREGAGSSGSSAGSGSGAGSGGSNGSGGGGSSRAGERRGKRPPGGAAAGGAGKGGKGHGPGRGASSDEI